MNRRIVTLVAAGAAATFAVALPLTAAPPGTTHTAGSSAHTETCDEGEVTVFAPTSMWPPNHKYDTSLFVEGEAYDNPDTEETDESQSEVILESHGYHDQYNGDAELNGSGGGNGTNAGDDITTDDATASHTKELSADSESGYPEIVATESDTGTVTTDWKARAERSGQDQTGRTYTLSGTATFSDGDDQTTDPTCSVSWDIQVPHDMRKSTRS